MSDLDSVFISTVETAVSTSVAQNKPLIVFNTDSSEESTKWADDLLSEDILHLISEKAVALKLVKDSTQFRLFEQIFPNVIIPSFYCIKVAAILDIIYGELDQGAFNARIEKVLVPSSEEQSSEVPTSTASASTLSQNEPELTEGIMQQESQTGTVAPQALQSETSFRVPSEPEAPRTNSSQANTRTQTPATSQNYGKREHKTLKEEAAEITAKKYKEEQRKKKQLEKEERERVKKLLKADQEERRLNERLRQQERERQRRLSNDEEAHDDVKIDEIITESQTLNNNVRDRRPSTSLVCALLIRLLDGSALRGEFKNTDTLADVRCWIDENRTDSEDPYCFHRTIPRATFGVTDEEKTLESLELTPRSALILKPFNSFTSAYNSTGRSSNRSRGGLISRLFGGISSFWYGGEGDRTSDSSNVHREDETIEEDDDMVDPVSPMSSSYGSPAPTPRNFNEPETSTLDLLHPSTLNLNLNLDQIQRPGSPQVSINVQEQPSRVQTPNPLSRMNSSQSRIRTLNSSENDDRMTYNGNHINLEDDPKEK